jgi:phage regulator Rha-like protein
MATKKPEAVLPKIHTLRKQKVVLDSDLAALYGVPTKRLNEAVRRNAAKFPEDFSFVITDEELAGLRSQIATSNTGRGGRRYLPRVFSEHGALMAAMVLTSSRAVQMSIYLVRAFVQMRGELQTNLTILKRLAEVDRKLLEHDSVLREVITRLQPLLDAPDEPEEAPKRKIGFHEGNR